MEAAGEYDRLRRAIAGERLPCALVDLTAFNANVDRVVGAVRDSAGVAGAPAASGKTLRVATKSIRSPDLLRRVLDRGGATCKGLLCYSVAEASFLAEHGFSDLLVAYPTLAPADLEMLARAASVDDPISIVVDSIAHVEATSRAGEAHGARIPVVIDLDVSYRPLGRAHVGVRRSPLRTPEAVVRIARAVSGSGGLTFAGLLGYEAHIAGVQDDVARRPLWSLILRLMKRLATPAAASLRARAVAALRTARLAPRLVNGGGTGSLASTLAEPCVTEVAAGSGFLAPHLFDGYRNIAVKPAAFFALQVTRAPDPGIVTCQGGGYVASGEAGHDRLPRPWLPAGLELLSREGAGEVQTPLLTRRCAAPPIPGDPVFFRHAKAGELCERFSELVLVEGDRIVGRAQTYRGLGKAFG